MPTAGPIVSKVEQAGIQFWNGLKNLGGAGKEAGGMVKGAIAKGDTFVGNHIAANEGSFSGAIKGIAQQKPVTSALAATGVVAGTVYGAKKVFGHHSERALREREYNRTRQREV